MSSTPVQKEEFMYIPGIERLSTKGVRWDVIKGTERDGYIKISKNSKTKWPPLYVKISEIEQGCKNIRHYVLRKRKGRRPNEDES